MSENSKNNYLENIRKNRLNRNAKKESECQQQNAAINIQRIFRGYSTRKKFREEIL